METTFVVLRLRTEHTSKRYLACKPNHSIFAIGGAQYSISGPMPDPCLQLTSYGSTKATISQGNTSTSDSRILGKSTIQNVDGKVNQTMSHIGIVISITVNTIHGGTIVNLLSNESLWFCIDAFGPEASSEDNQNASERPEVRYKIFSPNCPLTCSKFDTILQTQLEYTLVTLEMHQATRWHLSSVSSS